MNRRELLKTSAALGLAAVVPVRATSKILSASGPSAAAGPASAVAGLKAYVCPPCGQPCDKLTFDHPGDCPSCGMALAPAQGSADSPPTVAILLFNGAQLIDFTGPWEVFGTAGSLCPTVPGKTAPLLPGLCSKTITRYTFHHHTS